MNLRHKLYTASALILACLMTANGQAIAAAPDKVLFYMNPSEYSHEVRLWHFYRDFWFTPGTMMEPVADEVLGAAFGSADVCATNKTANLLVLLKPEMSYNPHMATFYGKVTVHAFSGSGKPLGIYEGESQKLGYIDVAPAFQVSTTYKLALQKAVSKMQADPVLTDLVGHGIPASETSTPCSMVSVLPIVRQ
jgi:hypothetical protein